MVIPSVQMLQSNILKHNLVVAWLDTIQKIIMQARYKASFSIDPARYLEFGERYSTSEVRFHDLFY